MLRQGDGEPLVLLHGIFQADRVWRHVVPPLAEHYDVIAPMGFGHGGRVPDKRPTTFEDWVDDSEQILDELGLDKPHLAGNSSGGWVALELARRGRAKTVCAIRRQVPGIATGMTWSGSGTHCVQRCATPAGLVGCSPCWDTPAGFGAGR